MAKAERKRSGFPRKPLRHLGLLKTADEVVFAQESESLLISLANVGLTALIDEATGFQRERAPDALRELLDRYLKKEYAIWAKRFPDDFYFEMFRLKRWDWKGMAIIPPDALKFCSLGGELEGNARLDSG
jgi:hypothetical protein